MAKLFYLFLGDPFIVDEQIRELTARLEKENPGGVSKQTFRLKETPLAAVLTQARTLPFLISLQIFKIADADLLKEGDLEAFSQYWEAPAPATCFILQSPVTDLKKNPLAKWAQKEKAEILLFSDRDKQGAASKFIRDKLRQYGKKMAPDAQRRLEEQVGDAPGMLDSILNQMATYAGEREEITLEMLEMFEEKLTAVNVYHLVDAISFGKTQAALKLFNEYIRENDADILSFLGLLHWQLRRLWLAAVLLEQGVSENSILFRCGVYESQGRNFMRQARQVSRLRLEKTVEGLFQLDWAIKTGRASEDTLAVEQWIVGCGA
ncbi:MAG TPA: DNA polymerase III subunit delta [Verrucomicrobiae bacterium]|jgi:DNA polymerase III delta subunit|nr:DNA polymerase III subunit delta [Verrucomicrobiae bacterium]